MTTSRGRTVLIADDVPEEAEFYADYVGRQGGVTPVTALSSREALERLDDRSIDCLVSDSLRTDDGESLVAVAKERWPDLPVLLHSGHPRETLPVDVVDGYLQKGSAPEGQTTLDALVAAIDELTTPDGPAAEDPRRDWDTLGTYDWVEEASPTVTALQALDDRTGVDVDTMPPLYETVEPDAVDRFLTHAAGSPSAADSHVQFTVGSYLLRLSADGTAELAPADDTAPAATTDRA